MRVPHCSAVKTLSLAEAGHEQGPLWVLVV
jgi:hypothetical protein